MKFGTIIRFTHWMCNAGQLTVVWGLHSDFLRCPFAFRDHIGLVFRVLSPIQLTCNNGRNFHQVETSNVCPHMFQRKTF